MINTSKEFQKLMNYQTDFKENAEIKFSNGTIIHLTESDFTIANNNVTDASETNGIPLGVAVCRNIQIELMNDDDRFSEYDFFGAEIRLFLTFQLSETVERIELGTFTVLAPETYGTTVIITALDDMHKADKLYSTSLIFPATIKSMLVDACNILGISLGTTSFLNDDFVVQSAPTDITFRQLIGYIAMIAGGNARIDITGRLRIISYDFDKLQELKNIIDGGFYNPWNDICNLDGGSFNPWNLGDAVDGGIFGDRKNLHILNNWSDLKVDTDDVVITGVQTTYTDAENEEHIVKYGDEGYLLNIDNPLIAGKEEEIIQIIGNIMVGGRFRQFSGDLIANPTIEFMDIALINDRKGNSYVSFVTDINFQFFGFTSIKNSAEPVLRNSAKTYSSAVQSFLKSRELIKKERSAREQAVKQLATDLQNSSGMFMTQEKQSDGSIIYYMHDKQLLDDSMIVWKLTSMAFGISTDGGKTYPYGFTVDGTTITRLLYAEGIDADYINTGAIRISDNSGKTIFLADYNTNQVYVDASNVLIGSSNIKSYIDDSGTELTKTFNSAIETKANEINLSVSNTYSTKIETNSAKNEAISASNENTTELLKSYSTTVQMNTAISAMADEINIEASKTYETISNATKQYSSLSASIKVNADNILSKVSRGSISSEISQESGKISIKSDRFSLESTNCTISENGTISAKNVDLSGKLTSESGKIGGFDIASNSLCYLKTRFLESAVGIYLGWDGLSVGTGFRVSKTGDVELGYGSDINVGGIMNFTSYSTYGAKIQHSGNDSIKFESNRTTIVSNHSVLGKTGGSIGFFGDDGSTKKSVSAIISTATATASSNATKINEIINALNAYNLL